MKLIPLSAMLAGGDRRSIGHSNQVVARVLEKPESFPELIECLWSDDPVVRMRAADAAEKVSLKRPDLLKPFKAELLGLADETTQAEVRWHLALMIPRLPLTRADRERAIARLRDFLNDRSSIVKTFALQGLVELSQGESNRRAEMQAEIMDLLQQFCSKGTPAMKARSRKLLKQLQKPGSRRRAN